jgi:lipoprotein NlpD
MDFRDLARINVLTSPYQLRVGQKLMMGLASDKAPKFVAKKLLLSDAKVNTQVKPKAIKDIPLPQMRSERTALPLALNKPTNQIFLLPPSQLKHSTLSSSCEMKLKTYRSPKGWFWPAQGKVVKGFSLASGGNRGIEIVGRVGEPVFASAGGKVVYSGSGLRGYGNLIIIKHNDSYLSAYAHNKRLLVKEGMQVKAGQIIALMGNNDAGQVLLHFEIRRNGKPINPMLFL